MYVFQNLHRSFSNLPNQENYFIFVPLVNELDLFEPNLSWTRFSCYPLINTRRSCRGHYTHVVIKQLFVVLLSLMVGSNSGINRRNALQLVICNVTVVEDSVHLGFRLQRNHGLRPHQIDRKVSREDQLDLDSEVDC